MIREETFKCLYSPVYIAKLREIDIRLLLVLLDIGRKSYMGSPMVPLDLTLSDLERLNSRSSRFQGLISREGASIGPMLILTINRKRYMWSQ